MKISPFERMKRCDGCFDEFPAETVAETAPGLALCPRCIFISSLYLERGIDKHFQKGGLMPHKLNGEYQKILKEFALNPSATYEKYVPHILRDARDGENGIVRLKENVFHKVQSGKRRIIFLRAQYDIWKPEPGKAITFQYGENTVQKVISFAKKIRAGIVSGIEDENETVTAVLLA